MTLEEKVLEGMDKSREAAVEIRGKSKNMWEERLSGIQSG